MSLSPSLPPKASCLHPLIGTLFGLLPGSMLPESLLFSWTSKARSLSLWPFYCYVKTVVILPGVYSAGEPGLAHVVSSTGGTGPLSRIQNPFLWREMISGV